MQIVLPSVLTAETTKHALAELPIIQRSEAELYLRPILRKRDDAEDFDLISRDIVSATPEALTLLAGITWWIRSQQQRCGMTVRRTSMLTKLGLTEELTGLDYRTAEIVTGSLGELIHPVVSIPISPARDLSDVPSMQIVQKEVEGQANNLFTSVMRLVAPEFRNPIVEEAIAEFVWEALLNVAEHAYIPLTRPTITPAWLSAAYMPIEATRKLYAPAAASRSSGASIASSWHRYHSKQKIKGFLEVAVFDAGVGVIQTLGRTFFQQHPNRKKHVVGARREFWLAHEEILIWALSPYGSRKRPEEYLTLLLREGWRGLYRIWYRLRRLDGFLSLSSGLGRVGTASAGGDHFQIRRSMLGEPREPKGRATRRSDEVPWPGTSLVLRIPLPAPRASSYARRYASDEYLKCDETIYVQPEDRNLFDSKRLTPDSVTLYKQKVDGLIRDRVSQLQANEYSKPQFTEPVRFILVVHPAVALSSDPNMLVPGAEPVTVSTLRAINTEATLTALLLKDQGLPGFIPVHMLLGVSSEGLRMAQAAFCLPSREARVEDHQFHPQIIGVVRPIDGTIAWMIQIHGEQDEFNLVETGSIARGPEDGVPPWWLELEHLYPGVVERTTNPLGVESLNLTLPEKIDPPAIDESLAVQVPCLAKTASSTRGPQWYWESEDEFVRTEGGFLVKQFLSLYSLCTSEPVIERFLSIAVANVARSIGAPGQRVLIVPERRTSSYLLAKKLLYSYEQDDLLRVVHVDDFHRIFQANDVIVLFKDAFFTESSSTELIEFLGSEKQVATILACADLRSINGDAINANVGKRSIFSWSFPSPQPLPELAARSIRAVDPLTSEILTSGFEQQVRALLNLIWEPLQEEAVAEGAESVLLDPSSYTYGFQFTGGAFHLIKFNMTKAFDNQAFVNEVERWLSAIMRTEASVGSTFDLVVLVRDEFAIKPATRERFRDIMLHVSRQIPSWCGRLFFGIIATGRRGDRQFIRRGQRALRDVTHLIESREDPWAQMPLFRDDGSPPEPIGEGFVVVYLDAAAVSGRTIRDLILMITGIESPLPRALHVCPLIDKLSPEDEALLRLLTLPSYRRGTPETRGRLEFHSLIQIRVTGYASFETTKLYGVVTWLLEEIAGVKQASLVEWSTKIRVKLEATLRRDPSHLLQAPLYAGLERQLPVSLRVVLARHLLALQQDAFPVMERLVTVCTEMFRSKDHSIMLLFALEPDLLDSYPMSGVFSNEIEALSLEILEDSSADLMLRSNALLVLFSMQRAFRRNSRRITESCLNSIELRWQWIGQLLAGSKRIGGNGLLAEAASLVEEKVAATSDPELLEMLDVLRAEVTSGVVRRPETLVEAENTILLLIQWGRAHHGIKRFGAWWRIHEVVEGVAVGQYVPVPGDLSETVIEEAAIFLRDFILPALHGLSRWCGKYNRLLGDQLFASAGEAQRLFQRFRRLAIDVTSGAVPAADLQRTWTDLRAVTMSTSVDGLFCHNSACVIGEVTVEGFGPIDKALPAIAQEPTGLALHMIKNELNLAEPFSVAISVKGVAPYELEMKGTLDDHFDSLHSAWGVVLRIPIIWDLSEPVRRILRIAIGNIRRHGTSPFDLKLTFSYTETNCNMRISNRRHASPRGAGTGLRDIRAITMAHGCTVSECLDGEEPFWIEFGVPINWLYLPRLV